MNTHEAASFRGNPNEVSALEYVHGVLRAEREAGLMIDRAHMSTVYRKLQDELEIPRLRAIRLMNQLEQTIVEGKNELTISVEDLRLLIQTRNSFI